MASLKHRHPLSLGGWLGPAGELTLGGAQLGQGGQGRVHTMDDLVEAVGGRDVVRLVAVDLRDGHVLRPEVQTSELTAWSSAAVFKQRLPGPFAPSEDVRTEFEGNLSLAAKLATASSAKRLRPAELRALEEATAFLFVDEGRLLVIGVTADAVETLPIAAPAGLTPLSAGPPLSLSPPATFKPPVALPMYRRLSGDLFDLQLRFPTQLTARHLMEAAAATLEALVALRAIGLHHGDIKEENVMWTHVPGSCAPARASASDAPDTVEKKKVQKKQKAKNGGTPGDAACRFRFSLTDFGMGPHLSARPNLEPVGTDGYICPLMYPDDDEGRTAFMTEHRVSHLASAGGALSAAAVWRSYANDRRRQTDSTTNAGTGADTGTGSRSDAEVLEKNDLYGLGITLSAVQGGGPPGLAVFARRLVLGSGLWDVRKALAMCRRKLAAPRDPARPDFDERIQLVHAAHGRSSLEGVGAPLSLRATGERRRVQSLLKKV